MDRDSESGPGTAPAQAARSGARHHPTTAWQRQTEQGYVDGVRRFILFHGKPHPDERGAVAAAAFLTALAVNSNVASSTQNAVPNAIVFLYRQISRKGSGRLEGMERTTEPVRRPVLFTRDEERAVLAR